MRRVKKLGSLEGLLKLIPGMGGLREKLDGMKMPDKELAKLEAIINSMTPAEREQPKLLNASRRRRIAAGSGTSIQDVNQLVKNFEQMRGMMQRMIKGGKGGKMPGKLAGLPSGMGMPGLPGMGMPGMPGMPGMDAPGSGAPSAMSKSAQKRKKQMRKEQRKKGKKR
jgi:signal recognition particle subunit SRP54